MRHMLRIPNSGRSAIAGWKQREAGKRLLAADIQHPFGFPSICLTPQLKFLCMQMSDPDAVSDHAAWGVLLHSLPGSASLSIDAGAHLQT